MNYDRRLKERKTPTEEDTFKVPQITDAGDLIGWYEHHIASVSHSKNDLIFGVLSQNDGTVYEIIWVDHMESWVQDGALG